MPLSVASTVIHHRNALIPKCTLRTGDGRHRSGDIPEREDVLPNIQSTLRVGDTLVPLIFISDGTHLSNFVGDRTEWPVCMPIGNLSSKIRQMPSTHCVVMVALRPIPIEIFNILQKRLVDQGHTN
jgi:hypothetical protein